MPYLEWDENDFPILRGLDDEESDSPFSPDDQDDEEEDDEENDEQGFLVAMRESALQSAIDFHAQATEEGMLTMGMVIETAQRFIMFLQTGK